MNDIQKRLFEMRDEKYCEFQCRLMPEIPPERVIGVRTPDLRKYAKELTGTDAARDFICVLPHYYYDENNLHSFIICNIRDFDQALYEVNRLLPYVDNWATCDSMSPKAFAKNPELLLPSVENWLNSGKTYTVRFGIEMLMSFFLDERYDERYPQAVCNTVSKEYYVNMMRAWYFATALAKQYANTEKYLTERRLDKWTHNKTIQKAVESYRITPEQKSFLKLLKY